MKVLFSPPDIGEKEIEEVIDALRSGWITTGPKTKKFEEKITAYCNTDKTVCLNSATAALELSLRVLGIGKGDEVITSAYTYTASCSAICHVGATPVLVDIQKDNLEMDYDQLEKAITEKTKAIIPVDVAGILCDYDRIQEVVENKKQLFKPSNDIQKAIGRVAIVADSAHGFGATRNNKKSGEYADFTCFSFHAVKNLTTAEERGRLPAGPGHSSRRKQDRPAPGQGPGPCPGSPGPYGNAPEHGRPEEHPAGLHRSGEGKHRQHPGDRSFQHHVPERDPG